LENQKTHGSPTRVLIIDDDDLIAGSLRHYLTSQGCDVSVALEGAAADALLRARTFDVVLLDPYMTGEGRHAGTLLSRVRADQPQARIIVLTGYGSPALLKIASECNAPLLDKPQSVMTISSLIVGRRADSEHSS
jgi:two-component system response regulator RegA